MILRFCLFGREVASVELWSDNAIAGVVAEELSGITGGSSHNFERYQEPPEEYYEERFGFQ